MRSQRSISLIDSSNPTQFKLIAPIKILQDKRLTENDKLVMAYNIALFANKGFNGYPKRQIAKHLFLHPNVVFSSIMKLERLNYIEKYEQGYCLHSSHKLHLLVSNYISIPHQVYSKKMKSGAKLLWGEYNSVAMESGKYFAGRKYTAERLGCSEKSITRWSKLLEDEGIIKTRYKQFGEKVKKKIVETIDFETRRFSYQIFSASKELWN